MNTLSAWRATAVSTEYPSLDGDASTDVLIIGGGITGLTLALLLARQGRQVILLEAHEFGSGATGNSTGNLYETLSRGLSEVESRWGEDVARDAVLHRRAAVDFIEAHARQDPRTGFRRCPLVQYAISPTHQRLVDQEHEALTRADCAVRALRDLPASLPPPAGHGVVLVNQAQFQPQAYLAHLAGLATQAGARLHEHTRVVDMDPRTHAVATASGTIRAHEIVMATHTPKGIRMVHAEMPVHREYGVALPVASPDPGPGIFWCHGDESLSLRTFEADGQHFVVCVGQEHPAGGHNARAALLAVEAVARRHFGDANPSWRWSAQNYRSADALPYIGRDGSGCMVATGFGTDGLVWGTVAARFIAEQLAGRKPDFGELCRPTRLSPVRGARVILEEVGTMTRSLVKDYLTHRQEERLDRLAPGDSAIVEFDGDSCAAWRSPEGELFAVSPVCPHMGCKVHWNSAETSWDCPCHGSRFRPDGTVIEGPALAPLSRKHPPPLAT